MLNNITVFSGTRLLSETISTSGSSLTLRCTSNSVETGVLWLGDTAPANLPGSPILRLVPVSEGLYQCLGHINTSDLPETNLTGESGNNIYVLAQCKNKYNIIYL